MAGRREKTVNVSETDHAVYQTVRNLDTRIEDAQDRNHQRKEKFIVCSQTRNFCSGDKENTGR